MPELPIVHEKTEHVECRPNSAPPSLDMDNQRNTSHLEFDEYIELYKQQRKANPRLPPPKSTRTPPHNSKSQTTSGLNPKATSFDPSANIKSTSHISNDNRYDNKNNITNLDPSLFANAHSHTMERPISSSSIPFSMLNGASSSQPNNGLIPHIMTPPFPTFNPLMEQANQLEPHDAINVAPIVTNTQPTQEIPTSLHKSRFHNESLPYSPLKLGNKNNISIRKNAKPQSFHESTLTVGNVRSNLVDNSHNNVNNNSKLDKFESLNSKNLKAYQTQQQTTNHDEYSSIDTLNNNFLPLIPQMDPLHPQLSIGSLSNFRIVSDPMQTGPIGEDSFFFIDTEPTTSKYSMSHNKRRINSISRQCFFCSDDTPYFRNS